MKKTLSLVLITLMAMSLFSVVSASAASYNVTDGVLYSYSGTDKSFVVPSGVTYIADSVFEGNTSLESVNLSNVEIIGNNAFKGCKNLKTVTGGVKVSFVGGDAFEGTSYLSGAAKDLILGSVLVKGKSTGAFTLPSSVSSLAPYCFSSNKDLTSVTLGSTATYIGEGAFYGCSNLSKISVATSVSHVGAYAFEGTKWLSSQTAEHVTLGDGILIKYKGSGGNVTIPDNIKQIGDGAFYNNQTLKTLSIPSSVTSVGFRAFANCKALTEADLPDTLVNLGKEAFMNCSALTGVKIPKSVELVGESVYLGCVKLSTAEYYSDALLPQGLFAGCTALKSVRISSETQGIGDYSFLNCSSLVEVSVPDTAKAIGSNAFSNVSKVTVYANESSKAYERLELMGINVTQIGDANCDGKIDVKDATYIQKAIANAVTLTFSGKLRGDVDFSGEINIKDGTRVQKNVAGLK